MRVFFLVCALGLSGCLEYKITVRTVVDALGKVQRVLTLREDSKDGKVWSKFAQPEAPYALAGSEEAGYTASAGLGVGRHPAGLRRLVTDSPDGEAAEGAVVVEKIDVCVGTLFRYHETIALGVDRAHIRRELPAMLDAAMRLAIETMRVKEPDLDFSPVEKFARESLAPRVEAALLGIYGEASELVRAYRAHFYRPDEFLDNTHVRAILGYLDRIGIRRRADAPRPKNFEEFFEKSEHWEFGDAFIREALARLPGVTDGKRAELAHWIIHGGQELAGSSEVAAQRLFPEEAKEKTEKRFAAAAVAAVGAYLVHGVLDRHDVRVAVRLPGQVVFANGSLAGDGEVHWAFTSAELILVPPEMTAYSISADGWVGKRKWSLRGLVELRYAMRKVDAAQRERVRGLVKLALSESWDEALDRAASEDRSLLKTIRRAMG